MSPRFLLIVLASDPTAEPAPTETTPATATEPADPKPALAEPVPPAEPALPACATTVKKRVMPTFPTQGGKTVKPTRDYTCKYKLWIGTDGVPTQVLPLACDQQFADPVLAAVQKWKFKPYEVDGVPTACTYELSVTFRP